MTEMKILLSEDQLVDISNQLHTTIINQIEQIKDQTMQHYRYMNKKQTCDYLQVTNNTLDVWIKEGLPMIKIHNSNRFDRVAIDQWLQSLAK